MEARFNFVTADPGRLDDLVTFTEAEVCPVVETAAGSLGTSLYANPEVGVAILESFWASHARLVRSEQLVSSARHEAVARATGTVCVERYQVPVFELDAPLTAGAGVRLTRMDVAPSEVEDAVEIYGDTAVAQLAETEGFCAALLMVDWATGHMISETSWRSYEALAGSRSASAAVRVGTAASAGCVIRAVEEYRVISSSARKPS